MFEGFEDLAQRIAEAITSAIGPVADFLEHYVWSWPSQLPLLVVLLLGTGLFVTFRLALIQIRGFKHAIDITRGRYDDPNDAGDLKHFQALTTALSATVGIGNIAGVAIAIRLGGPGALFWMWVTAFLGMAIKFTECTLALHYRNLNPDGSVSGGPMYYIEKGLGQRWLAVAFAVFAVICSFGTGNMNQSNTMADQMRSHFGVPPLWSGLIAAILVGMVIIGGIRRIGKVTAILAPAMALLYVAGALVVLMIDFRNIPSGLALIFTQAFAPEPLVGGAAGSFMMTMMWGIRRGLFSNEAGQGSAPIAHAAAKTDEPVREGLVALLEPFIDTLVICTMTGLVIIMSGAWLEKVEGTYPVVGTEAVLGSSMTDRQLGELRSERAQSSGNQTIEVRDGRFAGLGFVVLDALVEDATIETAGGAAWNGALLVAPDGSIQTDDGERPTLRGRALLTGAPLTAYGFRTALPGDWGNLIVTIAVILFAVSTGISWSYYGDRATEFLFGGRAVPIYRWVYVCFFFLGAILPLKAVWTFGDVALGLMSFPNLIALLVLSGQVVRMTRKYMSQDHKPEW